MSENNTQIEEKQFTTEEEFIYNAVIAAGDKLKGADKNTFLTIRNEMRYFVALERISKLEKVNVEGELTESTPERINEILKAMGLKSHQNELTGNYEVIIEQYGGVSIIIDKDETVALMRALVTLYTGSFYSLRYIDRALLVLWQKINNTSENPFVENDDIVARAAKAVNIDIQALEAEIKEEVAKKIN